ncbi:MAG: hypothetical protein WCJ95_03500 [Mariniphaga sp.]
MKRQFYTTGVFLLVALLICSSCNQRPKVKENQVKNSKGQTGTVEVEIFDAVKLKDQLVDIIKTAPKPADLVDFINKGGYSYMADLTLSTDNAEKYLTLTEQSLAAGVYKFDLYYAKVYNRYDLVDQIFDVEQKLVGKIGLQGDITAMKKYNDRIKQNKENTDSLNVIISAVMNELGQSYLSGEHSGVYALSYVSANIEGLYILTQIASMAKDNTELIKLIGLQKDRVKTNYQLLEIMAADPAVAPIFEKMKPILNSFSGPEFTAKQFAEVTPLIAGLRNEIGK